MKNIIKNIIKNKFVVLSIKNKIMYLYITLTFFILGIFMIIVFYITQKNIFNTVKLVSENNIEIIKNQISNKIISAENISNMIIINLNSFEEILVNDNLVSTNLIKYNKINKVLYNSLNMFKEIDSIVFVDNFSNVYSTNTSLENRFFNTYTTNFKESFKNSNVILNINNTKFDFMEQTKNYITLSKKVIEIKTGVTMGYLFVNINELEIENIYDKMVVNSQDFYYIVSNTGTIYSAKNKDEIGKLYKKFDPRLNLEKSQINKYPIYVFLETTNENLVHNFIVIFIIYILILIVCVIFSINLSKKLSYIITKPIYELTDAMEKVTGGDLTIRIEVTTLDETKTLSLGFNEMLSKINDLLLEIKQKEKDRMKIQLSLIQSQIRPHFLYNTLDTIYVLAHMNRIEETKKVTKALADFYRKTLNQGKEEITLKEEMEITKAYLDILHVRYQDKFEYKIKIDDNLLNCKMLKLTIQPIVENAIYHGIKENDGFGFLEIYSEDNDNFFYLVIKDNGKGISSEKISEITNGNGTNVRFGLNSVDRRLKLFFGEDYGLHIESVLNKYTIVKFKIPKEW